MKELAADWNNLGSYLDFSDPELKQIEKDVSGVKSRTDYCFSEVVVKWQEGPKDKFNAKVLADAVAACDHRILADEIRKSGKGNKQFSSHITPMSLLQWLTISSSPTY